MKLENKCPHFTLTGFHVRRQFHASRTHTNGTANGVNASVGAGRLPDVTLIDILACVCIFG